MKKSKVLILDQSDLINPDFAYSSGNLLDSVFLEVAHENIVIYRGVVAK